MGQRRQTNLQPLFDLMVNLENYESKIDKSGGPTACWPYTGPKHRQGYGFIGARRVVDDRRIMAVAHRVAARIKLGRAIGPKEMVIHTCSNPSCQNPAHIFVGTAQDRNRVMYANGRGPVPTLGKGVRSQQPQAGRQYRRSIPDMLFIKNNDAKTVAQHFNIDIKRARAWKQGIKSGYRWLDNYKG